jgi:acetyl esterase/lipase
MSHTQTAQHGLIAFYIFITSLIMVGCSAAGLLNSITSKDGYSIKKDIAYGDGPRAKYDLYLPDDVSPQSPVVVFFYGGGWSDGSKKTYLFVGQSLASEGIIVAIVDYRLYPQVVFPGFVEDGAQAVAAISRAAVEGQHGIPVGKHPLFLMGHSAGAQIAALLTTDTSYFSKTGFNRSKLNGFIGLAGPYNFLPLREEKYKRIFPEKIRAKSQPIHFVSGIEPPMMLIAGRDDTTVVPENSISFAQKLRQKGVLIQLELYNGVDHVDAISSLATALPGNDNTVRMQVLEFIRSRS